MQFKRGASYESQTVLRGEPRRFCIVVAARIFGPRRHSKACVRFSEEHLAAGHEFENVDRMAQRVFPGVPVYLYLREGLRRPRNHGGSPLRRNHGDRKSTRLNSSHMSISYAV